MLEKCLYSDSFVSVMFHCSVHLELQCRELRCLTLCFGYGLWFCRLRSPWFRSSFPEKCEDKKNKMVRGGSSGGGQSSLGYLFGSTETPQPKPPARAPAQPPQPTVAEQRPAGLARTPPEEKPALAPAKTVDDSGSLLDMGGQNKMGRSSNNYHRADGQNTGNFITVSFLIYLLEFQRPCNVVDHYIAILCAVSF